MPYQFEALKLQGFEHRIFKVASKNHNSWRLPIQNNFKSRDTFYSVTGTKEFPIDFYIKTLPPRSKISKDRRNFPGYLIIYVVRE